MKNQIAFFLILTLCLTCLNAQPSITNPLKNEINRLDKNIRFIESPNSKLFRDQRIKNDYLIKLKGISKKLKKRYEEGIRKNDYQLDNTIKLNDLLDGFVERGQPLTVNDLNNLTKHICSTDESICDSDVEEIELTVKISSNSKIEPNIEVLLSSSTDCCILLNPGRNNKFKKSVCPGNYCLIVRSNGEILTCRDINVSVSCNIFIPILDICIVRSYRTKENVNIDNEQFLCCDKNNQFCE